MKKVILALVLSLVSVNLCFARSSDDGSYPNISGEVLSEYVYDVLNSNRYKVRSNDKRSNGYFNIEPVFALNLNRNWSFNTSWLIRPVENRLYTGSWYAGNTNFVVGANGSDDYYGQEDYIKRKMHWDDYGVIVEELTVDYKAEDIEVGLGKFNPTFGKAFDKSKFHGVYGTVMPEEYELKEKLGAYTTALFELAEIRFNIFFDDTTGLSRSALTDRGRDKSAGGAGNTNKPNNFSLTMEGKYDQFNYNLGFRHLSTNKYYESDEKGYVIGLDYLKEFETNNFMILPFAELASFKNFDGMKGRDVWYLTASLPVLYKGWNFTVSDTIKRDDETNFKNYTSYLFQYSFGYKFKNGLMFDVARKHHRYVEKANYVATTKQVRKASAWGLLISYMYKF